MQSGKENQERPKRRRAMRNSGCFFPRKYSIFGFIFISTLLNLNFFFPISYHSFKIQIKLNTKLSLILVLFGKLKRKEQMELWSRLRVLTCPKIAQDPFTSPPDPAIVCAPNLILKGKALRFH